jgi:hypothetical protein
MLIYPKISLSQRLVESGNANSFTMVSIPQNTHTYICKSVCMLIYSNMSFLQRLVESGNANSFIMVSIPKGAQPGDMLKAHSADGRYVCMCARMHVCVYVSMCILLMEGMCVCVLVCICVYM